MADIDQGSLSELHSSEHEEQDNNPLVTESAGSDKNEVTSVTEENSSTVPIPDSKNVQAAEENAKDEPSGSTEESTVESLEALMNGKLQTISHYMNLVANKANHLMMLKEQTIMGFLVLCLGDDDFPEVVESSFHVFQALSKHEENLSALRNLEYIIGALRCVASNSKIKDSVRRDAKKLLRELKSAPLKNHAPLSELSDSMKNVLASGQSNGGSSFCVVDSKEGSQKPTDLNATFSTMKRKNKGRETVLFVENGVLRQKAERTRVTQVLISVPGIISVTYDLKKDFCIVRGKRNVAPEDFGRAVASLGLASVYLVRKNENKEEIKVRIQANQQENENVLYPPYPEEQENEDIDNSGAVAKQDQHSNESSFFSSAKDFIKRSFYW